MNSSFFAEKNRDTKLLLEHNTNHYLQDLTNNYLIFLPEKLLDALKTGSDKKNGYYHEKVRMTEYQNWSCKKDISKANYKSFHSILPKYNFGGTDHELDLFLNRRKKNSLCTIQTWKTTIRRKLKISPYGDIKSHLLVNFAQ